jgi:hypothetical protein
MSAKNPKRADVPAFPKRKPTLRLVKSPDERSRPEPDQELRAALDDFKSRARAQRERIESDSGSYDAA